MIIFAVYFVDIFSQRASFAQSAAVTYDWKCKQIRGRGWQYRKVNIVVTVVNSGE